MAARDLGSRPPIAAEVGRDRLTSVGREPTPRTASGGQNASGGGHLIGVPLRRTAIGDSGPSEPIKITPDVPARQRSAAWRRPEAGAALERLMDRCVRDARL